MRASSASRKLATSTTYSLHLTLSTLHRTARRQTVLEASGFSGVAATRSAHGASYLL
jgi:hypothetical protein